MSNNDSESNGFFDYSAHNNGSLNIDTHYATYTSPFYSNTLSEGLNSSSTYTSPYSISPFKAAHTMTTNSQTYTPNLKATRQRKSLTGRTKVPEEVFPPGYVWKCVDCGVDESLTPLKRRGPDGKRVCSFIFSYTKI
jgi:hypothetical protein